MLKKNVIIGSVYWTRIGSGKGRVRVLRERVTEPKYGCRKKTVFICVNLATKREIERGAGALHLTQDFMDREADLPDRKSISAGDVEPPSVRWE